MSIIIIVFTALSLVIGALIDVFNVEKLVSELTGLKSNYGLLGVMMILNVYSLMYLGIKVGGARKLYDVKYPTMYANKHDNKNANLFNCIQRAHQNCLEGQPLFLTTCYLASQKYPLVAGIAAFVVILGKMAYAAGYSTGEPSKRSRGFFGYLGVLVLLGCSWIDVSAKLGFDIPSLIKTTLNM